MPPSDSASYSSSQPSQAGHGSRRSSSRAAWRAVSGRALSTTTWTPQVRSWLARLDHAGIFLLIAGTYTPFGLLVMSAGWAASVLSVVWSGAALAIALKVFWLRTPKWVSSAIGLALGWVGVAAISQLVKIDLGGVLLVVAGGLLYSAGAIVYAVRRPDPAPRVFGYHELFHVLTLAAAACQFAAVAFFVLPRA